MDFEIISLALCLFVAFIFGRFFEYIKWPKVSGQLLAGMLLATPFIKPILLENGSLDFIRVFSELGVIFLLFLTGLEINVDRLKESKKDAIAIAFFGAIIPFVLGFILLHFLGYSFTEACVFGACLSISAEGTTANVLIEMKKIDTRVGNVILEAGMIDDTLGIIFLSAVLAIINADNVGEFALFPIKILVFVGIIYALYKILPYIMRRIESEKNAEKSLFTSTIIICLMIAIVSEVIGLGSILGALVAGILVHKSIISKHDEYIEEKDIGLLTMGFIVPIFFVYIGLNINWMSFIEYPGLIAATTCIAIIGKIIGSLAAYPFSQFSWRQLYVVGWAMNSRGIVELVIAEIARNNGLLSQELYSAVVVMAIITTFIFPFVMKRELVLHPKIMR